MCTYIQSMYTYMKQTKYVTLNHKRKLCHFLHPLQQCLCDPLFQMLLQKCTFIAHCIVIDIQKEIQTASKSVLLSCTRTLPEHFMVALYLPCVQMQISSYIFLIVQNNNSMTITVLLQTFMLLLRFQENVLSQMCTYEYGIENVKGTTVLNQAMHKPKSFASFVCRRKDKIFTKCILQIQQTFFQEKKFSPIQ